MDIGKDFVIFLWSFSSEAKVIQPLVLYECDIVT